MKSPLLVILGMHRSGTSCVASMLHALGLYTGSDQSALQADQFNEKGYFEDASIVEANETLLMGRAEEQFSGHHNELVKSLNRFSWIFGAFADHRIEGPEESDVIQKAISQYLSSLEGDRPLAIKDPRTSLTLSSWRQHATVGGAIILLRNPNAVIESLYVRDGIPPEVSEQLWRQYTFQSIAQSDGLPRILIRYERLFEADRKEVDRLLDFLAEHYGVDSGRLDLGELLDVSLNHSTSEGFASEESMEIYQRLSLGEVESYSGRSVGVDIDKIYSAVKLVNKLNLRVNRLELTKKNYLTLLDSLLIRLCIDFIRWRRKDRNFGNV